MERFDPINCAFSAVPADSFAYTEIGYPAWTRLETLSYADTGPVNYTVVTAFREGPSPIKVVYDLQRTHFSIGRPYFSNYERNVLDDVLGGDDPDGAEFDTNHALVESARVPYIVLRVTGETQARQIWSRTRAVWSENDIDDERQDRWAAKLVFELVDKNDRYRFVRKSGVKMVRHVASRVNPMDLGLGLTWMRSVTLVTGGSRARPCQGVLTRSADCVICTSIIRNLPGRFLLKKLSPNALSLSKSVQPFVCVFPPPARQHLRPPLPISCLFPISRPGIPPQPARDIRYSNPIRQTSASLALSSQSQWSLSATKQRRASPLFLKRPAPSTFKSAPLTSKRGNRARGLNPETPEKPLCQ